MKDWKQRMQKWGSLRAVQEVTDSAVAEIDRLVTDKVAELT
jgi:hypothetical protein